LQLGDRAFNLGEVFAAEDGDSDRVVEDERLRVIKLVCGATHGDAKGSAGWAGGFHGFPQV